jgi:polyhydroxyalkanoate synthesis regulator phasin
MKSRRWAIVGVTALAAAGGGAAIAATGADKAKETEDAILSDAANQLGVDSSDLRGALSDAEIAQIDKAVEDGDLTEAEADAIKEHMRESGLVLGLPGGPGGPRGMHGPPDMLFGGPPVFAATADELGIPEERLHRQLLSGKSMREIAEANGKTLADVKAAAKDAIEEHIADEVDEGDLTEQQADRLREDLPNMQRLTHGPRFRRSEHGLPLPPPPGFGPPPMSR